WVNGAITTSSGTTLDGLFYSPKGNFTATSELEMYGSIFALNYDGQSSTLIHYDQAAASAGEECPIPPHPTCGSAAGQQCTMDSDCCQPLYCLTDHTCGFIIQ